jgi:hypothetical protein
MTEAEWLEGIDPEPMLRHLGSAVSDCKLRLYACAWGYDVWHLLTDARSREAILTAERYADGLAGAAELTAAFNAAQEAWKALPLVRCGRRDKWVKSQDGRRAKKAAAAVARDAADSTLSPRWAANPWRWGNARQRYALANHLRDLFGNPFRRRVVDAAWLAWNGRIVPKVTRAIYDGGNFDHLPILADTLEEAGCTDSDILAHCRGPGSHVRGCWVLDLILGKS